jgi:formate dehydrogenase major subunit
VLYPRAPADPQGRPWSERERYIWWDGQQRRWTGYDVPDFPVDKPPDYVAPPRRQGHGRDLGHRPVHHAGRRAGWLFALSGLLDGPMPTRYEPLESTVQERTSHTNAFDSRITTFGSPDSRSRSLAASPAAPCC